jgi:D-glycero-D-manno-heptose 1,7-bisphosphate phosphatase
MMTKVLFLDRDGVINKKVEQHDYVKNVSEFVFCDGALDAMKILAGIFEYIFIVTNQQGVSKGLLTDKELEKIHRHMMDEIIHAGGRVDKIYICPHLEGTCECRKPKTGMAEQAFRDFPQIKNLEMVMVGDSDSDMQFARKLRINCVRIGHQPTSFESLFHFANFVKGIK